jgi:cellulose synthase/poly-beta-1,6-N-acetylglucosamine synthase-like glycosyltransferase
VHTLTRTPSSFRALVKQRVRWNVGYLETIYKERDFYMAQLRKGSSFGVRALVDMFDVVFIILFPIIELIVLMTTDLFLPFSIGAYAAYVAYCIYSIMLAPKESIEFKNKRIFSILCFPFVKIALDYFSWMKACIVMFRKMSRTGSRLTN